MGPYKFVRIDGLAEQAVGEALLKEVYKRAEIDISVTPMPGKRALQQASSGAMDGETLRVFALGENVKSLIRVPTALSSLQTVAFRKTGSDVSVTKKEDLNNYSNVIVTGVLHTHAITEGVSDVNEVSDPSAMFKLVQGGRADIALTSYLDGLASIRKLKIEGVEDIKPALNDQPLFHYVHESKQDVVPVVDAIIKGMADSGELAELRTKLEQDYLAQL
ncbi:transporter substrate-binding domain-containing protein [uncultured Tateyamaria sp.]|uniref:transporter substrate-binding domain-containing protein n=1 Tax=uncultured Tateyamaria sp. TaxID=455651 RepID=UPI0026032E77|nr:transporter substrate-binding domain-containing protein [uncultured Tateyamaria sp.]